MRKLKDKAGKGNNTLAKQVALFWQWFAANAERIASLYSAGQIDKLAGEINDALDKIEPELAWELGPGKREPYLLTISSEGEPELREIVDYVLETAPQVKGWEFYSSRQRRLAPEVISLPERGIKFKTTAWTFVPVEQPGAGRIDLVVVDSQLASSNPEAALRAVSIYLDAVLGEDTVEQWIGKIDVKDTAESSKAYPIHELPDYLLRAINHKKKPLSQN